MAGIGFELRRLYGEKGLISRMKAHFFSIFITVGPTLVCILMLTLLQGILFILGVSDRKRELFMAAVVYAFIFSLIITGGFTMLLSRYVSDRLYNKETGDILPSLMGAITVCIFIGGVPGLFFWLRSSLDGLFGLAAFTLYMELIIIWILSVFISALKNSTRLFLGFFSGAVASIGIAGLLLLLEVAEPVSTVLISIDAGFFIMILLFSAAINSRFKSANRSYYKFLEYMGRYPSLFLMGTLNSVGIYLHNFIFWSGSLSVRAGNTFVFAPAYDVPSFWAFLTVLPAMVVFVVSMETSFYEKCKIYYRLATCGGCLDDIESAKTKMCDVLSQKFLLVVKVQLFFTAVCLLAGKYIMPAAGLSGPSADIFNVLVTGYFAYMIMQITILILLHFDDRRGALSIVFVFLFLNFMLTLLANYLGSDYHGFGFLLAAALSLTMGLFRLNSLVRNIEYHTYCLQPVFNSDEKGLLRGLSVIIRKSHDKR